MPFEIKNVINTLPWNSSPKIRWKSRKIEQIKYLVLHQALGTKTVENTNAYHISKEDHTFKGIGAPHICYTFFIEPTGTIYQCNELTHITAQVAKRNTDTLGICLGGWYNYGTTRCRDGDAPEIQIQAATWLIKKLMKELHIGVDCVLTHNEAQAGGKPSCPGNSGTRLIADLKIPTT